MKLLLLLPLVGVLLSGQTAHVMRTAQLEVGAGSGEIIFADLNADGSSDVVAKHLLQRRVTVWLSDRQGGFVAGPGSLDLSYGPGAIALGDVTGDGISDLGMASRRDGSEYASVFPGDGRGGFREATHYRLNDAKPYYKPAILFADVNHDGKADLVTANERGGSIQFIAGNGTGGFAAPATLRTVPGAERFSFALGDVDGDGRLDVVVAAGEAGGGAGRFIVALASRGAEFTEQPGVAAGAGSRVETIADVTGDGHMDVVVSHTTPHLSIFVNDGGGRFTRAPGSPISIDGQAFAVVVRDFNGDRHADLAAATVKSVTVLAGDGRGFRPLAGSPFRAGPGAFNLAVGDLNHDGKPDLAASSFEGNALTLLFAR
jgi:hypothetical protein